MATDERTRVICDACREGDHQSCAENVGGYDHAGVDYRVCWCGAARHTTPSAEGEQ